MKVQGQVLSLAQGAPHGMPFVSFPTVDLNSPSSRSLWTHSPCFPCCSSDGLGVVGHRKKSLEWAQMGKYLCSLACRKVSPVGVTRFDWVCAE